jgi:2,4-dienoyl-CoA reductase-like NADH-dependent reductase (Old Yellow Enzyme family)
MEWAEVTADFHYHGCSILLQLVNAGIQPFYVCRPRAASIFADPVFLQLLSIW